jgi:hypothetical protein
MGTFRIEPRLVRSSFGLSFESFDRVTHLDLDQSSSEVCLVMPPHLSEVVRSTKKVVTRGEGGVRKERHEAPHRFHWAYHRPSNSRATRLLFTAVPSLRSS